MTEIESRDVYEGAYLLLRGHRLKDLTKSANRQVTFVLCGDGIAEDSADFRAGRASVNVAMYLFTLEKLKDRLFGVLRGGRK